MKNKIGFITLAFTMLLCISTSCKDEFVDYNVYGSISGTVVKQDGNPVQNALVTLKPSIQNAYTGYDGSFEFVNLGIRQYNIWVQKDGYEPNNITVTAVAGENVNVNLVLLEIP